ETGGPGGAAGAGTEPAAPEAAPRRAGSAHPGPARLVGGALPRAGGRPGRDLLGSESGHAAPDVRQPARRRDPGLPAAPLAGRAGLLDRDRDPSGRPRASRRV